MSLFISNQELDSSWTLSALLDPHTCSSSLYPKLQIIIYIFNNNFIPFLGRARPDQVLNKLAPEQGLPPGFSWSEHACHVSLPAVPYLISLTVQVFPFETSRGWIHNIPSRITMLYGSRYLKIAWLLQNARRTGKQGSCVDPLVSPDIASAACSMSTCWFDWMFDPAWGIQTTDALESRRWEKVLAR
jgi:hypothetical protein